MEKELENIINEINENLSKKLVGWKNNENELFVVFYDNTKYAEFQGEFGRKARSIIELKPLLDYLDSNGYKTNLD